MVHRFAFDFTQNTFPNQTTYVAITSNTLHIMPDSELVLKNIRRVLKPNALLIAPSFSHGH
ncbi:MAG: methyltransferase domain-containing protein [Ethanoligenens sp.]